MPQTEIEQDEELQDTTLEVDPKGAAADPEDDDEGDDTPLVTHSPGAVLLAKQNGLTDAELATLSPEQLDTVNYQLVKAKSDHLAATAKGDAADPLAEIAAAIAKIDTDEYDADLRGVIRQINAALRTTDDLTKKQAKELEQLKAQLGQAAAASQQTQQAAYESHVEQLVAGLEQPKLFGVPGKRSRAQAERYDAVKTAATRLAVKNASNPKRKTDAEYMAIAAKRLFAVGADDDTEATVSATKPSKVQKWNAATLQRPTQRRADPTDGSKEATDKRLNDFVAQKLRSYGYKV